jgi:hypothetical protein
MKGIVFTEFLDMVSQKFGDEMVDDLIEAAHIPHGGAYTSVGTYPHSEIVALVQALSVRTGLGLNALLEVFGRHLYGRFYQRFPHFMDDISDPLEFLLGVESVVHVEVKKLYPDAQLPRFITRRIDTKRVELIYQSRHDFSALALGLIQGCGDHYQAKLEVSMSPAEQVAGGVEVSFRVVRCD